MAFPTKIKSICAQEILDSRGNPTVEAVVLWTMVQADPLLFSPEHLPEDTSIGTARWGYRPI